MNRDDPAAPGEARAGYPLDHTAGYFVAPRDLGRFECFMHDPAACQVMLALLARVRHRPGPVPSRKGPVNIMRGQCVIGIRELADCIGRDKSTIERVLHRLEGWGLITRSAGQSGTIVTLVRYGNFPGPVLAHADSRADGNADSRADLTNGGTEERKNGRRQHTPRAGEAGPGSSSTTRRPQGRELVEEIFAHYLALCEQAPATALKRPSPIGTHHVISETLHHPKIREASPEEIKRALDMLAVQARAKADAREADPWWPLRSAWSPNVLADALAMPDEQTARQRATRRSQGAHNGKPRARSVPALTAADYRAMSDEGDEQP